MNFQQWLKNAANVLVESYGLDKSFADKTALFIAYLQQYGLRPQITSAFRSPEYQEQLRKRYLAGDRSVIVPPAKDSKHSVVKFGKPAALAIDISTTNKTLAAQIAEAVGLKTGIRFSNPDPVHFYV